MTEQGSQESRIDESILDRMTPEGRDLAKRVLASTDNVITVSEGRRKPLFPSREVPSYLGVVGPEATADYTRIREDLDAQELRNRRQARARRLGRAGLE